MLEPLPLANYVLYYGICSETYTFQNEGNSKVTKEAFLKELKQMYF